MSLNKVDKIDDLVKINNILISVSDKSGLDNLIPLLVTTNPEIRIFSTGGTYKKIETILGNKKECLTKVSSYTGQPETQGGLVKTLDFKIYLGLLTETYNKYHNDDLIRTAAVPIDMVIVNLYPFKETVAKEDTTVETARANIDIGGPCMIRASAKNYLRVLSVTDPKDYDSILSDLKKNRGSSSLDLRFKQAKKSFLHTADYDRTISDYLNQKTFDEALACYKISEK